MRRRWGYGEPVIHVGGDRAWCPVLIAPVLAQVLATGDHPEAGQVTLERERDLVAAVAGGGLFAWRMPSGQIAWGVIHKVSLRCPHHKNDLARRVN